VWQRVSALNLADRVVVATDSDRVADVARHGGAEVALTRADHQSGTERTAEVALHQGFEAYDVILNVQGDEPFINEAAVRGAATLVERGTFSLGTAAVPADPAILADPAVVKVVADSDHRALYFSRAPIPFLRDEADTARRDEQVKQHVGVYAYTRDALARWVALPPHPLELIERLEQLRPLAHGMAMGVATVAAVEGGGIDTEQDLALANARWSEPTPSAAGAH
jgi:3-deoxy-manno-octulosonate cytidylyltransferase (CMP-KDO synthetase)